jgi:hypothetical protein
MSQLAINETTITQAGFKPVLRWNGTPEEGKFILPNWLPVPKLEIVEGSPSLHARIGSQQSYIRSEDDLSKFLNISVPTFCEPK